MQVRVGLKGLGRVGRNLFRCLMQAPEIDLVAVVDAADATSLAYLLNYDTLLGRAPRRVEAAGKQLRMNGPPAQSIQLLSGAAGQPLPWRELGVQIVVDTAAAAPSRPTLEADLAQGAARVVLCAPAHGRADVSIIPGATAAAPRPDQRIIAVSSVAAHAALPILKMLDGAFGVKRLYYTNVQAYGADQRLADVPGEDLRRSRAAAENIVPVDEGHDSLDVGAVLPSWAGRASGMALRVPVNNGSVVDMVTFTERPVEVATVNEAVQRGIAAHCSEALEYCQDPIVSSDVQRSPYSGSFDSLATLVLGQHAVKTLTWYDNGWGYAQRIKQLLVRLASGQAELGRCGMTIQVGINGFGRIGRSVFRILMQRRDMEVVAINDITPNEALAYLLKYDTIMGPLAAEVRCDAQALYVDGKKVLLTAQHEPRQIGWGALHTDVVVESTGRFTARAELTGHLEAGAKRVLLTVPPKDEIDNMVVLGVNDATLQPAHRLVSNASCTTNCLAPIAKILDDAFGIEAGLMTTVHAYTNDQRLEDAPHKDLRRSRAAAQNIIPTTTGAARAVGKVLPHLKGKLDGLATRVPVPDGSIVDLVVQLKQRASRTSINQAVRQAAEGPMRGVVEYSEAPLVSRDILGNPASSIFDSLLTQTLDDGFARVVSWYDNEWGYSNRCVDLIARLAALGA